MERKFKVGGLAPYHSIAANLLIASSGLGILGGFVKRSEIVKATMQDTVTQEQLDRQILAIQHAYEEAGGWHDVKVVEISTL